MVRKVSAQFPTAEVTSGRNYRYNQYASRNRQYTEYDAVVVKLENGISMEYRVYADKSLERMKIEYPKASAVELINQLNNLKF